MDDGTKISLGVAGSLATALILFALNRRSKKRDDHCTAIANDVKQLSDLVLEVGSLIALHQSSKAPPSGGFRRSRENVATKRKAVAQLQKVIFNQLVSEHAAKDLRIAHLSWVNATDSETGLITEKQYAWTSVEVTALEQATDIYVSFLATLRGQIISGAVKVR